MVDQTVADLQVDRVIRMHVVHLEMEVGVLGVVVVLVVVDEHNIGAVIIQVHTVVDHTVVVPQVDRVIRILVARLRCDNLARYE